MRLLMLAILGVISFAASAQDNYYFESTPVVFPKVSDCPEDNYLSKNVLIKLEQFNQIYTKKVELGGPQYIMSTEIIKPDLYYSIQKLSKYFCKSMKKGTITKDEAEAELVAILDKCFQIFSQDTTPIEAELRAVNNPEAIVGIFDKIVIKQE